MSILERVYEHRKAAVAAQKLVPSQRVEDLERAFGLNLAPPVADFAARTHKSPCKLSLMAEIKRASPSRGIIDLDACSIEDLQAVRQALACMPNRPAILHKDFVFDEYQILEARLAGADTVLLIVKMLDQGTLTRLYKYSQGLRMEPLVEVNNAEEMDVAVRLGAKVIGVNNRNLTSFEVDTSTTTRIRELAPESTVLAALSGISSRQDIEPYLACGVGAVLIGEALMRAENVTKFITELLHVDEKAALQQNVQQGKQQRQPLLVKICGTRSAEAAETAVKNGADLVGMILVEGTKRCVSTETAQQISKAVKATPRTPFLAATETSAMDADAKASSFFSHTTKNHLQHPSRALLVGVFRNQPLGYVLQQQRLLNLDLVQLHGSEPLEWAALIPCPVIRSFNPGDPELGTRGYFAAPLLDSGAGGTGQKIGTEKVLKELARDQELRIMLAGGLNPDNVADVVNELGSLRSQVAGVDVSSGVETNGKQNLEKIKSFIAAAKST